ncbi:hypothetical protein [Salinicola sp. MIT1003]|uniref:hypothetical protein n=1 Tax=Salinicola sp. MIT1003 TaxID=1882734 RepID=UPI00111491E5|nr:hypothetical protein [Salinicola sp. MIT1003]
MCIEMMAISKPELRTLSNYNGEQLNYYDTGNSYATINIILMIPPEFKKNKIIRMLSNLTADIRVIAPIHREERKIKTSAHENYTAKQLGLAIEIAEKIFSTPVHIISSIPEGQAALKLNDLRPDLAASLAVAYKTYLTQEKYIENQIQCIKETNQAKRTAVL